MKIIKNITFSSFLCHIIDDIIHSHSRLDTLLAYRYNGVSYKHDRKHDTKQWSKMVFLSIWPMRSWTQDIKMLCL